MSTKARPRRSLLYAVTAAGVAVVALAGCSASGGGGASTAPSSTAASVGPLPAQTVLPTTSAAPTSATASAGRSATRHASVVPTPGSIDQTVASRAVRTLAPVKTGAGASFGSGVSVRTTAITAITAKAHGPGEISGPALEIALRFSNTGARRANLNSVIVNLAGSDGSPASSIAGSPADPVSGYLAPQSSVVGRYVFTLATSKRRPVTISVGFTPSAPVVQIVGNAG